MITIIAILQKQKPTTRANPAATIITLRTLNLYFLPSTSSISIQILIDDEDPI